MQAKRTAALVAAALYLLSTGVAQAAPNPASAGVAHARAAGISVDELAVPLMTSAPVGTCANDPTLAGCQKITRVVYSPPFFGLRASDPSTATAAQIYLCGVGVLRNRTQPYKAVGLAQGDVHYYCDPPVIDEDVYYRLSRYSIMYQRWEVITSAWHENVPIDGQWRTRSRRAACESSAVRAWRIAIDGYSIYKGVMYAGHEHRDANLPCNYT